MKRRRGAFEKRVEILRGEMEMREERRRGEKERRDRDEGGECIINHTVTKSPLVYTYNVHIVNNLK